MGKRNMIYFITNGCGCHDLKNDKKKVTEK